MDSSALSTAVVRIQCDGHTGTSIVRDNVIVLTNIYLINVDTNQQCSSNCAVLKAFQDQYADGTRDHDDSNQNVGELECSGKVYVCGNCRMVLKPKEESDLEKQLNIQRIQHQIELEALQHEQRMKHLRTLLLS